MGGPRLGFGTSQLCTVLELDGAIQHWKAGASGGAGAGQPVAGDSIGGIQPAADSRQLGDVADLGESAQDRDGHYFEQLSTGIGVELPPAQLCFLEVRISR